MFSSSHQPRVALLTAFVVGIAIVPTDAQVNKRAMKIRFFSEKAGAAYEAKDWAESIKYYQYALKLKPHDGGLNYNLACSAALGGETEVAVAALERAIALGWDDPEWMQRDTDLRSVRDHAGWDALKTAAQACREETVRVIVPEDLPADQPAPLIVALHGFGSNPREFAAYWRTLAAKHGAVLAAPRGTAALGDRAQLHYGWFIAGNPRNLDVSGGERAVRDAIARAEKAHPIDTDHVVVVCFSQGADLAVRVVRADPGRYAGVVSLGAYLEGVDCTAWPVDAKSQPRVALLHGARDRPAKQAAETAQAGLKQAGCPVQVWEIPVIGHEIPEDSATHFDAGLHFVWQTDS
jgi:predicted esterase